MQDNYFFDESIPSPCFVIEEHSLLNNLTLMQRVQREAGVSIILAFKGFAMWKTFPIVRKYLSGCTASSLYEARLGYEEMKTKTHSYAVVYFDEEFDDMMKYSSHITFNSIAQYKHFKPRIDHSEEKISCGIRVNPEYSVVSTDLYNPCSPGSRLGEVLSNFNGELPQGIEGLHFHALCESSSYDFENLLNAFIQKFDPFISQLKWVNFGGGHLMTRKDYDVNHLIEVLKNFKKKYPNIEEVILEPGSAVAWETGVLISKVMDIHDCNGIKTLILDVSFTAHMPDTLEMPYRPKIVGASDPVAGKPTYRIGGTSCLSGDFMYEYSFDKEMNIGDRIVLLDMIHYTMVKTTMFNGVKHPSIAMWKTDNNLEIFRTFDYEDYRNKLC
ncbi:MAG: carboxynorspermidine decarboxylase [Saprospiraceae bacterium]|nr:carboxynorspermidine decarboxylase [Saprospiraceae bacterium]